MPGVLPWLGIPLYPLSQAGAAPSVTRLVESDAPRRLVDNVFHCSYD